MVAWKTDTLGKLQVLYLCLAFVYVSAIMTFEQLENAALTSKRSRFGTLNSFLDMQLVEMQLVACTLHIHPKGSFPFAYI